MEQSFWTLILGVAGILLCFAEERSLEPGGPHSPKLGNILIKVFFLPHQSVLCLCLATGGQIPLFSNSVLVWAQVKSHVEHTCSYHSHLSNLWSKKSTETWGIITEKPD